jgi:DUF2934 family protein
MKAPRTKREDASTTPADPAISPARAKRARTNGKAARPQRPAAPAAKVAEVAHQLFVERGSAHGHDLDDWLEAERRVRASVIQQA